MRKRKREFDRIDDAEVDLINTCQNADPIIEAMDFERAFSMLPDQQSAQKAGGIVGLRRHGPARIIMVLGVIR